MGEEQTDGDIGPETTSSLRGASVPSAKGLWRSLAHSYEPGPLMAAAGQTEEAGGLLQGVYGWFIEGLNIADPVKARALLDAL